METFQDFIACSACHRDYLVPSDPSSASESNPPPSTAPLPFYLTTCRHTVCHSCLFSTKPAPQPLDQVRLPCPACQTISPLALLSLDDPSNEMTPCFAQPSDLLNTTMMTVQFQMINLMNQIKYLKPKCIQQKKTITRLLSEVKKGKAYKTENEQLRAEIASLQSQVYQRPTNTDQPIQIHSDPPQDYGGSQNQSTQQFSHNPVSDQGYGDDAGHSQVVNSRKRRAADPAGLNDGYQSVYSSNDSQGREDSYEQLRPTRLTLTPASRANHHLHHWTQNQTIQEENGGLPNIEGIKTSKTIHFSNEGDRRRKQLDGRSSRMSVAGSGGGGGPAFIKEHLSNFAYAPSASRASHRPSSSASQQNALAHGPPYTYQPPASPIQTRIQQQQLLPPSNYSYFSQSQAPAYDSDEDRRAMPPPPLPSSSRSSIATHQTRPFVPPQIQTQAQSRSRATPRSTPRPTPISTHQHSGRHNTASQSGDRRFGEEATGQGGGGPAGIAKSATARMPFRPSG